MLHSRMLTPLPAQQEVDINAYQHKKTLAQGMMDLALLLANANQLRYVLESKSIHPYYSVNIVLLAISISLQITVGIALIINSQYGVKKEREMRLANRINNFTLIGIFLITIVNVFISAFGVADNLSSS
ncbi:ninjurin-A-like [Condylostylus longicornis]|uniref:ninjurin-A-like n=1 Tax=Condylostylus longicornis TaxID=2530218 RepID=UPI00244DAB26|nr:ninjurin-A-like [Condylostylus longicornis]